MSMDKREFRVLIKHCYLMKKNVVDAKLWLDKYYGNDAPGRSTIHAWYAEYKRGLLRTDDAPRSGRPNDAVNSTTIKQVQRIIYADCQARVREIADQIQISKASVLTILHDHLKVKKLFTQWVPLELDATQKKHRITHSKFGLKFFCRKKMEFLQRFVTVNAIWIYHVALENVDRASSSSLANRSKRRRMQQSSKQSHDKVLAIIFWNANGIVFIDYRKTGVIQLTADEYNSVVSRLHSKLFEKRPNLTTQKPVLFHYNTMGGLVSTQISLAHAEIMTKLQELQYEVFLHPANSPDLDPSEFYLFPNLRGWLQGKRFTSIAQLDMEVTTYCNGFDVEYFTKGIEMLEERWRKCVELNGNYTDG